MKYFAKYLPIEGEATCTNQNCEGGEGCGSKFKFNCKIAENCINCGSPLKQDTKLFLCSRDIPKGEKLALCDEKEGSFIKVGEISPDATWVKEGDELKSEEVRFSMYDEILIDIVDSLDKIFNHGYYEVHKNKVKIICEIKGPCGHFH